MRKLIVGAFAAAAFVAAGSVPAQAAFQPYEPIPVDPGIGDGSGPHSSFDISVTAGDGRTDSITLSCPQEWSEHPNAAAVCGQLKEARGQIGAIAPADGMCTKEYAPVRVLVTGHWQGEGQFFMKQYSNHCEAVFATGGSLLDF